MKYEKLIHRARPALSTQKYTGLHIRLRAATLIFITAMLSACAQHDFISDNDDLAGANCVQPPTGLPSAWSQYIYPNCFINSDRLGRWNGGTTPLTAASDPSRYILPVTPKSIGSSTKPVHLYVIAHGWAPGLRKAVNAANSNIRWWSSNATDKGVWESNWAWVGINSTREKSLTITPRGLAQQIEAYERAQNSGADVVILLYSWVDNSATITPRGTNWNTWPEAAYSEAYTNLNGLRLASAIQDVTNAGFLIGTKNKLHVMGHSHGSKVATVASMELQQRGFPVRHLSLFDSPESEVTLVSNSANLLGYYFDKMSIVKPSLAPSTNAAFVDAYISMFGYGYAGATGSSINNVVQVGLDSAGVFYDTELSNRHAYSATWYAGAWAATKSGAWPSAGLGWPPIPNTSTTYYQDFPLLTTPNAKNQWTLYPGSIQGANWTSYGTATYSNPTINITPVSTSGRVFGNANTTLSMPGSFSGVVQPSTYVGKFQANKSGLYGLSFDMKWDKAQPKGYIVVTVQSPAPASKVTDQQIALVFDASSRINDNKWHSVSFNTYSTVRSETQFEIHYFPDATSRNNPANLSFTNFRYVKQQ